MRRDPYAESSDYAKFRTLARNVYNIIFYTRNSFLWRTDCRVCVCMFVCLMGNILIVTGRHPTICAVRYTPAGAVFTWKTDCFARYLANVPWSAKTASCIFMCVCCAEREKQSVGAVRRFSMVFNVYNVCGRYIKRGSIRSCAHAARHIYVHRRATADLKLIYLTEKRRDLSTCLYTHTYRWRKKNNTKY